MITQYARKDFVGERAASPRGQYEMTVVLTVKREQQ